MMKTGMVIGLASAVGAAMLSAVALTSMGCAGGVSTDPLNVGAAGLGAVGSDVAAGSSAGDGSWGDGSQAATDSGGDFTDDAFVDSGGQSSNAGLADAGPGSSPSGKACPPRAFEAETAGCTMTLRTPADCATISFSEEFAWGADACHTPYYLQVTGNPPDENNYNEIYVNAYINALAWAEPFTMEFVDGLSSVDGWYHWRICNAYLSGCSATRAFKME